jgi:NADH:ubiquinone oxidoreductase subunit F (NADH-binding)
MIAALAIGSHLMFNYFRGEFTHPLERWRAAVEEAYRKGYLGKGIFGTVSVTGIRPPVRSSAGTTRGRLPGRAARR